MKSKKIISLCIATLITVPLFSGCGKDNDTGGTTDGKKDFTISMLLCDTASSPYSKDWKLLKWIKEETGATLDIQAVPSSDYNTKVNMTFNSGNVPDIICHNYPTAQLALGGQLLPINKYMDKLPNLEKFIKDNHYEDVWNNLKFSDGNIYTLPNEMHNMSYQPHQWMIRKDIFEKNNLPIPKTLDDVLEVGKKLKELYPNSAPITNRFGSDNIMGGISGAYGTIAGYTFGDGTHYDYSKKIYEFAPITQNWKDMVIMANKLYTSGVLDKEYATLNQTVYEQKITQGDTFIIYDWTQNIERYVKEGKKVDPDYDLEIIYPPTGYKDKYALQWCVPWSMAMTLSSSLADDPKHLDDVLSYINWGYSDEAQTLMTFGKEGDSFEEKDGVKKYKEDKNYIKEYGVACNSLVIREDMDFFLGQLSKEQSDLMKDICDKCVVPTAPTPPLTESDMDSIQVYQTSLKDYCVSMMEKFINGTEPISNWDKYVQQCKDKGCDKMLDVYKKALQAKK